MVARRRGGRCEHCEDGGFINSSERLLTAFRRETPDRVTVAKNKAAAQLFEQALVNLASASHL